MDFKEFQRLVKFAKKSGIVKLKLDNVEFEFSLQALDKHPKNSGAELETIKTPQFTEMDALMWSVAGVDNTGAN